MLPTYIIFPLPFSTIIELRFYLLTVHQISLTSVTRNCLPTIPFAHWRPTLRPVRKYWRTSVRQTAGYQLRRTERSVWKRKGTVRTLEQMNDVSAIRGKHSRHGRRRVDVERTWTVVSLREVIIAHSSSGEQFREYVRTLVYFSCRIRLATFCLSSVFP